MENKIDLTELRNKKAFICDMDGVIYHGNRIIPHVTAAPVCAISVCG